MWKLLAYIKLTLALNVSRKHLSDQSFFPFRWQQTDMNQPSVEPYPPCSPEGKNTCPPGMSCDPVLMRCYHEPRRLGEPCGNVLKERDCSEYYLNTTRKLVCSKWCGTCILEEDNQPRSQNSIKPTQRVVKRCGLASNVSFTNWEGSIISSMPVMYPRNDDDLEHYLNTIAKHNCTARPIGATHTSSQVITSASESQTVGISLAEYQLDDVIWDMVLNQTSKSVRAPAGASLFDLYQAIRPHGFFLPTQTAGPIFTLAGIVSNSVHGGVYNRGYISEYITALRVAIWNGTQMKIKIFSSENELRFWRTSFGMLGIITAIEFALERRNGFTIESKKHTFSRDDWNRKSVDAYFKELASTYLHSETFFNPYMREVNHVLFKSGEVVPLECQLVHDENCEWDYPKAKCQNEGCCEYKYKFGDMTLDQSCRAKYIPPKSISELSGYYSKLQPKFNKIRYDGSPDLPELQNSEMCILMKLDNKIDSTLLATVFYGQTFSTIDSECLENVNDVNDGFYLRAAPHGIKLMAYAVPLENLFDLLTAIQQVYEEVSDLSGHKQMGNAEFRFLNISDKSVLSPTGAKTSQVKTGQFVNCEMVFNVYPGDPNKWWATSLYKFEQRMHELDGIVHTGKSFCYGENEKGEVIPYGNKTCIKRIFNDEQKTNFNAYRQSVDPFKLFDGGASKEFF